MAMPETATEDNRTPKLDVLAQVLIGTFAAISGLLTLVGLNSDRAWAWLDQDSDRWWLLATGALGTAAIGLCLAALALPERPGLEAILLGVASLAYVAMLGAGLLGVAEAADTAGRPTFSDVSLRQDKGESPVLRFALDAESIDSDQRIRLKVTAGSSFEVPLMNTVLRPGASGAIHHKGEISLPTSSGIPVQLMAVRVDDHMQECPTEQQLASATSGPTCVFLLAEPSSR